MKFSVVDVRSKLKNFFIHVNVLAIAVHVVALLFIDATAKISHEEILRLRLINIGFHFLLIAVFVLRPKMIGFLTTALVVFLSVVFTLMELQDFEIKSLYQNAIMQTHIVALILVLLYNISYVHVFLYTIISDTIYTVIMFRIHPDDHYTEMASVGLGIFSFLYLFVAWYVLKMQNNIVAQKKEKEELIDSIDDFFICFDQGRVVYTNQITENFLKEYGYSNLKRRKISEVFHDIIDTDFFRVVQNVEVNGGQANYYQFFPVMQKYFQIHIRKADDFVSVLMRDVTEIESERQLLFKKNTAARKSFHDISSILQSMSLRMMVRDIDPEIIESFEKDMKIIKSIIDDYKKFGHTDLESTSVDLKEIVQTCTDRISASGVGIKSSPVTSVKIKGSYLSIYRILDNLTSNAIKYTANNFIIIDIQESHSHLTFSISNETKFTALDRDLFEMDFRMDEAKNTEGEGLGLHTCKQLAESMNGRLSYTFENKYLTFYLDLVKA